MIPTSHRRARCFSVVSIHVVFLYELMSVCFYMYFKRCFFEAVALLLPAHHKKRHLFRCLAVARQRPTLTGGSLQLPSAQKSLTAVFGMGTGVTSLPLSPDSTSDKLRISSSSSCLSVGHVRLGTLPSSSTPVLELLASLRSSQISSESLRLH